MSGRLVTTYPLGPDWPIYLPAIPHSSDGSRTRPHAAGPSEEP